jgi:integrase
MAKDPVTQPELLSREEIARLFAACTNPVYRMILQTIYATGLRVFEACALRVRDIDSAADRMCIRVENGKGAKTRYTCFLPACWNYCEPTYARPRLVTGSFARVVAGVH